MTAVCQDRPAIPEWAADALAAPVGSGTLTIDRVTLSFREWKGDRGRGILLIHGGGGHAHWWDFVAPLLGDRQVIALDLSGHGDSGTRHHYEFADWVDEVVTATRVLFPAPPIVVGHSLGGAVGMYAGAVLGDSCRAIVAIDSLLGRTEDLPPERHRREPRSAESPAELRSRFRLIPDDGAAPAWVLDHVFRHSIRRSGDRYGWKFDPPVREASLPEKPDRMRPAAPVVFLRCEHGLAGPQTLQVVTDALAHSDLRVLDLLGFGHNPMLDDPAGFATVLGRVLTDLEH